MQHSVEKLSESEGLEELTLKSRLAQNPVDLILRLVKHRVDFAY